MEARAKASNVITSQEKEKRVLREINLGNGRLNNIRVFFTAEFLNTFNMFKGIVTQKGYCTKQLPSFSFFKRRGDLVPHNTHHLPLQAFQRDECLLSTIL